MADENDTPANDAKPTPRRRAPRKAAAKADASAKPAAKRASRPSTAAPKKQAAAKSAPKAAPKPSAAKKQEGTTDRARAGLDAGLSRAAEKVGGRRNAGLIAGGLAVGAAAAALFSLRSSTPKKGTGGEKALKAHQPDGSDSSDQMDALIADENMIPEKPQG